MILIISIIANIVLSGLVFYYSVAFYDLKKDKPQEVSNRKCSHKNWNKWASGTYYQRRSCVDCGIVEERSI